MKTTDCVICEKKGIALHDTIKVDGSVYCGECLQTTFPDQKALAHKQIEKEIDPTICSSCSKDFGDLQLGKISKYPICDDCSTKIRSKTFPTWVKGFFAGIILIVVISFCWNWKYYTAYRKIKEANAFFAKEDYEKAYQLMSGAGDKVPEVDDLQTVATYFKGIMLLTKDKSAEALTEFEKCRNVLPADYNIDEYIVQARMGAAYDSKDYDGFLTATKDYIAQDSTKAMSFAAVASAYACVYANKGNDSARRDAFYYLGKAKQIDDTSKDMQEYYDRVEYRIETRKIISRDEYVKLFPEGRNKN